MMICKKKTVNRWLYHLFVIALAAVVLTFSVRASSGNVVEEAEFTDGELLQFHNLYQTGSVYDRQGNLLVKGSSHKSTEEEKLIWSSDNIKKNFEGLLGMDISKTMNSGFTLAGHAPVLFGSEDDRFTIDSLMNPFKKRVGGSIEITLDKDIQQYIRELTTKYGINKDDLYLLVSNYKTGEVRAVFNEVCSTMLSPGSTIKSIVAAGALSIDPELADYTYSCNNSNRMFNVNGKAFKIRCADDVNHGIITMQEALARSCNGFFIDLLLNKLEKKEFMNELKKWGLNGTLHFSQFSFWDGAFANIDKENPDTVDEAYLLGAIGQANCRITPFNLHYLYNGLMNSGKVVEPYWISRTKSTPESDWKETEHPLEMQVCDSEAADKVADMLEGVTREGTGTGFYMENHIFAAKTGTAELADSTGLNGFYTVWTSGALRGSNDEPLSITVAIDKVDSSITSETAGLFARDVLNYISDQDKMEALQNE